MTRIEIMSENTAQVLVGISTGARNMIRDVIVSGYFEQEMLVNTTHGLVRICITELEDDRCTVFFKSFRDEYEVTDRLEHKDLLPALFSKVCTFPNDVTVRMKECIKKLDK